MTPAKRWPAPGAIPPASNPEPIPSGTPPAPRGFIPAPGSFSTSPSVILTWLAKRRRPFVLLALRRRVHGKCRDALRFRTMNDRSRLRRAALVAIAFGFLGSHGFGQTPEQEKAWAEDRVRANAQAKADAERLARERAARKADPMAWVRTLDPMTSGGWEFRSVGSDGSFAVFSSTHQFKRAGQIVTVWLRHEYAESQTGDNGPYLSVVQKTQFDCKKQQSRTLLAVYYSGNNIQGNAQTEDSDPKSTPWDAIVPGTRDESNFLWACAQGRAGAK
jgi:hypothetical protein